MNYQEIFTFDFNDLMAWKFRQCYEIFTLDIAYLGWKFRNFNKIFTSNFIYQDEKFRHCLIIFTLEFTDLGWKFRDCHKINFYPWFRWSRLKICNYAETLTSSFIGQSENCCACHENFILVYTELGWKFRDCNQTFLSNLIDLAEINCECHKILTLDSTNLWSKIYD